MKTKEDRPTANYNASQAELYAILLIVWKSCIDFIARFTAHNTIYDIAYVTGMQTKIAQAKALPGKEQRDRIKEEAHNAMETKGGTLVNFWQRLETYINKTLPRDNRKTKLQAAGSGDYAEATNNNWDKLVEMSEDALEFIADVTAELTTAGMPANFVADYTAALADFVVSYDTFTSAEQGNKEGTDEKVEENNELYDMAMDMMKDGQVIFYQEPATRERFVFATVKEIVTAKGPADIVGSVRNSVTGGKIPGTTVLIVELDRTAITNEKSVYDFGTLPSGTYTIVFSATGYESYTETEYVLIAGTTQTLDLQLLFLG